MRLLAVAGLGLVCATPARALADPTADQLVTQGQEIAKQGRFSEAIDKFKAADRIQPRALHACLVALAYTRRELWTQAMIFLDLCEQRAKQGDPLPAWIDEAEKQMRDRLAVANVAPVELVVEPPTPDATLTVSSFPPDETFGPRTIQLPPGRHLVIARAPNRPQVEQTIDIADKSPRRLVFAFTPPPQPQQPRPLQSEPVEVPERAPSSRSRVPRYVMWAGGALVLGGGATHLLWFKPARDELAEAVKTADFARYQRGERAFARSRGATIILYGAGVVTMAASLVLQATVFRHRDVTAAIQPHAGGGLLTIGWTR